MFPSLFSASSSSHYQWSAGKLDCHGHVHLYEDYTPTRRYYEYQDHQSFLRVFEKCNADTDSINSTKLA